MTFVRNFLVISLLFCASIASAKTETVLVLGDSLSAGYGIKLEQGWVNLLQQDLSKEANIINASVSGETTSGGLTRLPALLKTHQPAVVVLELGGNDGLRGQPLKLMQDNLQAMISTSQAAGAKVLLVGMQIPTNYGQRYTRQFKESYSTLAEKNHVALVPFLLEGVATNGELFQADKIHPTADAQPTLAKNVKPHLLRLLNSK
jgi:acyl-CoA thioesterase I